MRCSPYNYQQPRRASACERGGGRRTLATSSQGPSRAAAVRGRLRALRRRLVSTQRGGAPGAVLPPSTGCRLPCSPTLASWCCWEVGATLPPLARRLRSEGRALPSDIPWASWGLLCGQVSQAAVLRLARSSPASPGRAPAAPPDSSWTLCWEAGRGTTCVPLCAQCPRGLTSRDPEPTGSPSARRKLHVTGLRNLVLPTAS